VISRSFDCLGSAASITNIIVFRRGRCIDLEGILAALIAAFSAIAGGALTSVFALKTQREARNMEQARWAHEAAHQKRVQFHDQRLQAYTDFYVHYTNAIGFQLHVVLERWSEQKNVELSDLADLIRYHARLHAEHASAGIEMDRSRTVLLMLTESHELAALVESLSQNYVKLISWGEGRSVRRAIGEEVEDTEENLLELMLETAELGRQFSAAARSELTN
jgi:hypothetical protein